MFFKVDYQGPSIVEMVHLISSNGPRISLILFSMRLMEGIHGFFFLFFFCMFAVVISCYVVFWAVYPSLTVISSF